MGKTREAKTQLYRHYDKAGRLLYVGISLSAATRLAQHREDSGWFASIVNVTIETFRTRREALYAEAMAIAAENPAHNVDRPDAARFAPPAPCATCLDQPHICIGMNPRRCERYNRPENAARRAALGHGSEHLAVRPRLFGGKL